MIFINTRPAARAKALSEYIKRCDITVYELPLLEIKPLTISATETQYLHRLAQGHYDALVAISPSAVELALKHYADLLKNHRSFADHFNPHCPIIAVGQATAHAFAASQHLSANHHRALQIICPKVANNEGMMAMAQLANLTKQQRVLIWRGQGGRRLLVNHLQAKGVVVESIEWYKRQRPAEALDNFIKLYQKTLYYKIKATNAVMADSDPHLVATKNDQKIAVLISSAESFEHWRNLLQEYCNRQPSHSHTNAPKLTDFCYLVLGTRLYTILSQFDTPLQPLIYYRIANLNPECIMAGLAALSKITPSH